MIEFLLKHYSFITHTIEGIAAIIGLFCLKKYKNTAAIFFIWMLVYLFFVDFIGAYTHLLDKIDFLKPLKASIFRHNRWWFTIFFDVIATFFFCILYQKILKFNKHKAALKYLSYAYLTFSIILIAIDIDELFLRPYRILYILSAILIILCAIFYFIEILQSNSLLQFTKSIYFYISISIFIWWLVVTPLVFYDMYYTLQDKSFILLKNGIYIFSNIFMYSIFGLGLIISKSEKIE